MAAGPIGYTYDVHSNVWKTVIPHWNGKAWC
jgi:hypothetical protein